MFGQRIVFVIGAGASFEYNFPLGSELKERIGRAVRFRFEHGSSHLIGGDRELLDHIRRHVKGDIEHSNQYTRAANFLANAIPSFVSVDEALHYVSSSEQAVEVGKCAIVAQIRQAERNSTLANDSKIGRIKDLPAGWIEEMLSLAVAGMKRDDLNSIFDAVTFINFNYDRAIEQYLYWALQDRMSASSDDAMQIVSNLKMLRPYGSIGNFSPNYSDELGFGSTAYSDPFSKIGTLGTYTDQKPMHDASAMQNALIGAKLIIFLGFGYHTSNLDLLKLSAGNGSSVVFGTVKGIHRSNYEQLASRIGANLRIHPGSVELHDMKAAEILRELRPRILMLAG